MTSISGLSRGAVLAVVVPSGVLEKLELDRLPGEPRQPLRPPRRGYLGGAPQLGQVLGLGWVSNNSQQ